MTVDDALAPETVEAEIADEASDQEQPDPGPAAISLRELIAQNVRRLRLAAGAQPDDLVRAGGQFGLDWTVAWVGGLERGTKSLTAEQLLALPFVLTIALGHRVGLADLLLGDDTVLIGKTGPVTAAQLREVVTEKPYRFYFALPGEAELAARRRAAGSEAVEKVRVLAQANLGDVDARALLRAEAGAGSAETRLARKLGVPDIVVIAAAASVFGRSLTEEMEATLQPADPEAPVPARATVTKRLTAAVSARIAEAAENAAAQPGGPTRLARIARPRPG